MHVSNTYTKCPFYDEQDRGLHPSEPSAKTHSQEMVNETLSHLEGFLTSMYAAQSQGGPPAIAPEKPSGRHAEREAARTMINDAVQANNDPEATITLGACLKPSWFFLK
jgi:hypothetical protein